MPIQPACADLVAPWATYRARDCGLSGASFQSRRKRSCWPLLILVDGWVRRGLVPTRSILRTAKDCHVADERSKRDECIRIDAVMRVLARWLITDEPGFNENLQMLRNGRLGEIELRNDILATGLFETGKLPHDTQACWVSKCGKDSSCFGVQQGSFKLVSAFHRPSAIDDMIFQSKPKYKKLFRPRRRNNTIIVIQSSIYPAPAE